MAAQVKSAAWVEWVAELLGGTPAPTFPPGLFYCFLDELPVHLIPALYSDALRRDVPVPLSLNPDCLICPAGQLPDELISKGDLVANFALACPVAWIRDPATKSLFPFWLGPKLESIVRNLRRGQDAQTFLDPDNPQILLGAGVLQQADGSPWPRRSLQSVDHLQEVYSEKGYAAFPGLIHPFQVAALRRYCRYLVRKGQIPLGDPQCPLRYVAHNEPVARFFHHQFARIASEVAGEPVKPSYVYLASYLSGAELKKHIDREQCEFTISLCLDFSPEPEGATPWPLCLDTLDGPVRVHQAIGDGLFYRGTRVPHYRDALGKGFTATSIFFHYVSASFTGSLD